jgi:cytochrome c peroxidase
VSQGKLLSIKNYYEIMYGILTPVQMEGLRLLLTPSPQQQFNQTEDRKVAEPSFGVSCLDCHANGHTNAAFHLNPDNRPQAARFRIETVSLRGLFNQQIHGSKRSLRSVEDFTKFEQRTAYFDGDQVTAAKKGVHLPDRSSQVAMMAQMQNMFDFPPAPKLDVFGMLDPEKATREELMGQNIFFGRARCGECHPAPFYLDNNMHDLKVERFYRDETIRGQWNHAEGPIKTFTLRGIKDSPPYLHDGRCLTLEDTVEFFNLVTGLKLTPEEKRALVAFMRALQGRTGGGSERKTGNSRQEEDLASHDPSLCPFQSCTAGKPDRSRESGKGEEIFRPGPAPKSLQPSVRMIIEAMV